MDNPKSSVEGRKAFDGRSVNQIWLNFGAER